MTNHTDTNSTACAEGMGCDNPNHTSLTCYEKYYQLEYEGPGSQVMDYTTWRALASTR
jgi:hypothetical protein